MFFIRNLPQALIDSKSLLTHPQTCSAQDRKVNDAKDNTSSVYRAYRDLELDTARLKYQVSDLQGMVRKAEQVSVDYLKRSVIACNRDADYVSDMDYNVQRQEDDPKEQERLRRSEYTVEIWLKLEQADSSLCQEEKHQGMKCRDGYDFIMISIPENKEITSDAMYMLWLHYHSRIILAKENNAFKLYGMCHPGFGDERIWMGVDIDRYTGLSLTAFLPEDKDGLVFGMRTCGIGRAFLQHSVNEKNRREALQKTKGLHYLMLWIKSMLRYFDDLLTGKIEKFKKFKEVRSGCLFNDRGYIESIWQEKVEIPGVRNAT